MEQWIRDAKKLAKKQAQEFVDNLKEIASTENLDDVWFVEEVVKYIHVLKETNYEQK